MECPVCETSEFVEYINYLGARARSDDKIIINKVYKCKKCKGRIGVVITYREDKNENRDDIVIG